MKSPTQRSLEYWRKDGWLVQKVEYWNQWANRPDGGKGGRKDLFGIIDVVALKDGVCYGVQVTSKTNVGARVKKATTECRENMSKWLAVPGHKLLIEGWGKIGHRWKRTLVEIFPVDVAEEIV